MIGEHRRRFWACGLTVLVLVVLPGTRPVAAGTGEGCQCCGCSGPVEAVCRLVCDVKEVKTTRYGMVWENYCLPAREGHCVGCSASQGKWDGHARCSCVHTRRKLVKYEEVQRVPTWRCVVQHLCKACQEKAAAPE